MRRLLAGWRGLGLSWAALLLVAGSGAAVLQLMGPPQHPAQASEAPRSPVAQPATVQVPGQLPAAPASHEAAAAQHSPAAQTVEETPANWANPTIAEPQAALLEPAPDITGAQLPRIAPDGRRSMTVYARPFNPADKRPRLAMVVVGFGLSAADSKSALEALPPAVTIGISPYVHDRTGLPSDARAHGHEFLLTLPMESQGYPLNDSGPRALLTGAEPADNARNLEWVLSRIQGEVGVTGASDGLRGERFAASPTNWRVVRQELADRGLLYVDPRPGAEAGAGSVTVSAVVDEPPDQDAIDAKLAKLEQRARDTGVAIGLAGTLRPVTIERIASWARGLDGRGIDLVPVSALAQPAPAPRE
jgi:polysaccharide deacetylase 2 family uncharacterized protein YibQ